MSTMVNIYRIEQPGYDIWEYRIDRLNNTAECQCIAPGRTRSNDWSQFNSIESARKEWNADLARGYVRTI